VGHGVQASAPVLVLYVPASHAVHATPFVSAVCPTSQMQSERASLPAGELVPAGHKEMHAPVPMVVLYVPASHAVHVIPFESAVYPTTQMQSERASLPAGEVVHVGHAEAQDPDPVLVVYVPPRHKVQFPAPVLVLYVPASHAVQATPSEPAV